MVRTVPRAASDLGNTLSILCRSVINTAGSMRRKKKVVGGIQEARKGNRRHVTKVDPIGIGIGLGLGLEDKNRTQSNAAKRNERRVDDTRYTLYSASLSSNSCRRDESSFFYP